MGDFNSLCSAASELVGESPSVYSVLLWAAFLELIEGTVFRSAELVGNRGIGASIALSNSMAAINLAVSF